MKKETSNEPTGKKGKKELRHNVVVALSAASGGGIFFNILNFITHGLVPGGLIGFFMGSIIVFPIALLILWIYSDNEKDLVKETPEAIEKRKESALASEEKTEKALEEKLKLSGIEHEILNDMPYRTKHRLSFFLDQAKTNDVIVTWGNKTKVKYFESERWQHLIEIGEADEYLVIYKKQ